MPGLRLGVRRLGLGAGKGLLTISAMLAFLSIERGVMERGVRGLVGGVLLSIWMAGFLAAAISVLIDRSRTFLLEPDLVVLRLAANDDGCEVPFFSDLSVFWFGSASGFWSALPFALLSVSSGLSREVLSCLCCDVMGGEEGGIGNSEMDGEYKSGADASGRSVI